MLSDVPREEKQTKNKRPILDLMPPSPLLLQWAPFCLWLMRWGGVKAAPHEATTALDAKNKLKTTLYVKTKSYKLFTQTFPEQKASARS